MAGSVGRGFALAKRYADSKNITLRDNFVTRLRPHFSDARIRMLVDQESIGFYFSPDQIPGLKLWIDPNDESTKTISSGNVTAITDKAQGLSFTTFGNAPADSTHITGDGRTIGALEFDSANTEALAVNQAVIGSGDEPFTVIAVALSTDTTNFQAAFSIADASTESDRWHLDFRGNLSPDAIWWTSTSLATGSNATDLGDFVSNEPHVITAFERGTSRDGYLDGAPEDVASAVTNNPLAVDRTSLGSLADLTPAGSYLAGKILLVLVYDRILTDAERTQVEDWAHRQKIHDPGVDIPAVGLVLDLDPSAVDSFEPTDLSGCVLFIDPDDDSTKTTDSGNVTEITDKSASGLTFTVPGGANPPEDSTFTTGDGRTVGALLFDDANTEALEIDTAAASVLETTTFTVVSVFLPDDLTTSSTVFAVQDKDVATSHFSVRHEGTIANDPMRALSNDGVNADDYITVDSTGANPLVAVFDLYNGTGDGNANPRLDGVAVARSGMNVDASGFDRYSIGRRGRSTPDAYASGKLLALIVYSRALTAAEVNTIEQWAYRRIGTSAMIANRAGKGLDTLNQATFSQRPAVDIDGISGRSALLFDDAASQHLLSTTSSVDGFPFSGLIIGQTNDDTSDQYLFSIAKASADVSYFAYRFAGSSTADLFQATVRDDLGVTPVFATVNAVTQDQTSIFYIEEGATDDRAVRLDGGAESENTATHTITGVTRIGLGVLARLTLAQYWSGTIGRTLLYKRVLTDAERIRANSKLSIDWGV